MATTTSASGCWKKNMYQLRFSCGNDRKPPATAAAGGTAIVTTRCHRSGWWSAAT